jgi:hypothetical protein
MMKNKLHRHFVTCRLCQLEQGRYCPALSEKTAQGMRERAKSDPAGFAEYVSRVIRERITGEVIDGE